MSGIVDEIEGCNGGGMKFMVFLKFDGDIGLEVFVL